MKIWFYIGSSPRYRPKIKYIFDLFFSIYGLRCFYLHSLEKDTVSVIAKEDLLIAYDKFDNLTFLREFSQDKFDLFFLVDLFHKIFEAGPKPSLCRLKAKGSEDEIPILFNYPVERKNELYYVETEDGKTASGITWNFEKDTLEAVFYADLFASSFYFVSFQEELQSDKKDKHKRFKAEFSFRKDKSLIDSPLVNLYFKVFFGLLRKRFFRRKLPLLRKSFWPGATPLAVVLTHDVDIMDKWVMYALYRAFQLLSKGGIGSFFGVLRNIWECILIRKNPAHSFDFLIEKEKELNFGSSFFFLAGKPTLRSFLNQDVTYDISNQQNKAILKRILLDSHEVGLHGSYNSAFEKEKMREGKKLLESFYEDPLMGIRQHFLRFNLPQTWYLQRDLDFSYDCSLGYPDASGFRSGLAFPFYPYDDYGDKVIEVLELNTNIMDQTYVKYKQQNLERMKEEIIKILEDTEKCGGLVTLIWHTNVVDQLGFLGFMETYQRILEYLCQRRFFVGSGKKIADWWVRRGNLVQLNSSTSKRNDYFWEYESRSFMDNITLELSFPFAGRYRVWAEKVKIKTKEKKDFVLIELYNLKPNQRFKIFLQRKDEE